MQAPDYFGLVAGVRTWRVANTRWALMGGWLWSWSMTDCWRRNEEWKEAECRACNHRIPGDECLCGIWACFDPEALEHALGPVFAPGPAGGRYECVSGIIGAGGDIVEHELGFRAQYAKVLAIFEDTRQTPKKEISEGYHCPIVVPADYDTFCAERNLIRLDRQ